MTTTPPGYRDKYGRLWHGPFPFTRDHILEWAVREQGIYQVLYDEQTVAYIGIATKRNTIRARLLAHVADRSNWARGRLTDVDKFSFIFYPCDDETAKAIESHVVSTEKPPFNVKPEYKNYVASITVH